MNLEALEKEALRLPIAERGGLAQRLWDSLGAVENASVGYDESWQIELERRAAEMDDPNQWVTLSDASIQARRIATAAANAAAE